MQSGDAFARANGLHAVGEMLVISKALISGNSLQSEWHFLLGTVCVSYGALVLAVQVR